MKYALLVISLLFTVGCTASGGMEEPTPDLPSAFEFSNETGDAPSLDWWTSFGDPVLDALIDEALAQNLDLQAGTARLRQARASLRIAGAELWPSIGVSGSTSGTYTVDTDGTARGDRFSSDASARLNVAYTADIFGGTRAQVRSAAAAANAAEFDYAALNLATQAEVASTYFQLLAQTAQLELAIENLEALKGVLAIVETRYEAGAAPGQELARQRAAVAQAEARIPALNEQREGTAQALAILLGRTPEADPAAERDILTLLAPPIDAGLPADLLLRRPDLRSAQWSLAGADADVGAARAAFLPTIDLSATLNSASLLDGPTTLATLAAGLAAPVFSGGRLTASLDRSVARYDELAALYEQSILSALSEVETALLGIDSAALRQTSLAVAATEASRAFDIAEARYRAGADDLLSVLDAQQAENNARDALIGSYLDKLSRSVDLFRALGGGWNGQDESRKAEIEN